MTNRHDKYKQFRRKGGKSPLKFRSGYGKATWKSMPFLGPRGAEGKSRFWTVPATGGYMGGHETGEALGHLYMKSLQLQKDPIRKLSWMVYGMFARWQEHGGTFEEAGARDSYELSTLSGQIVGFLSAIEGWAVAAAALPTNFDAVSPAELLERANDGLLFDEEAYLNSLPEELDLS